MDLQQTLNITKSMMSAALGYKLRARNITAIGVQAVGKVLNKTVSTGDDLWGLPWADLPPSLKYQRYMVRIYLLLCVCRNNTLRFIS